MSEGFDTISIDRFVKLARQGRRAGAAAAHGEQVCAKLAAVMLEIGDDAMLLDYEAMDGAGNLLKAMVGPFPTDKDKERVYALLRKAAL